ncbi:MAG TPA: inner membrane CreD family protein [Armatimonadota bacterium]|nr:inner membrane CreD family protein [Armatimonadota bacterium]
MNAKRLAAVILIYAATSIAWVILGAVNQGRSSQTYSRLAAGSYDETGGGDRASVQELWGQPQTQSAPKIWTTHVEKVSKLNEKGKKVVQEVQVSDAVVPIRNRVSAGLVLQPRRKGLLWYSTYKVRFAGDYSFKNEFPDKRRFFVKFAFPAQQAIYDDVSLLVADKRVEPAGDLSQGVQSRITLEPGQQAKVHMSYGSQGMDTWSYRFSQDASVSNVKDFEANVRTNCHDIDFPTGCVSPTDKRETDDGWDLKWRYANLVSGFNIGVNMPQKLNPGPFAARLSYFAPVSLLFFFAVLLILGAVKDIRLHPMHYLFLAAAFFSFHLLFSYMVDHVTPFYAFLVSSAVSLILVITYLRLVTGWRLAVLHAGVWQFVFLVLFTYAFFFEGYTGLTITVGAIVTLAVMMQMTGRVNWEEKLATPPPPAR